MKVLCSTGALGGKGNFPSCEMIVSAFDKMEVDGYELLVTSNWKEESENWCKTLKEAQISIPIVHFSKKIGDNLVKDEKGSNEIAIEIFDRNCHYAEILNVRQIVLHLWGWPDMNFSKVLEGYKELISISKTYGIEILVEMIPCREESLLKRMDQVLNVNPMCRFTLDSRFLKHQGLEKKIFMVDDLWKYNRVAHVHISDCLMGEDGVVKISPILFQGEGIIDFPELFSNLLARNYNNYITIESVAFNDNNKCIEFDKLNSCAKMIREVWKD